MPYTFTECGCSGVVGWEGEGRGRVGWGVGKGGEGWVVGGRGEGRGVQPGHSVGFGIVKGYHCASHSAKILFCFE